MVADFGEGWFCWMSFSGFAVLFIEEGLLLGLLWSVVSVPGQLLSAGFMLLLPILPCCFVRKGRDDED